MTNAIDSVGVVLHGESVISVERRSLAGPSPQDAVVDVHVAGICGSDLHMARFTAEENERWRMPGIFAGHEGAGLVRCAPPDSGLEPGQPVLVYHYESCWECEPCRAGYLQWCAKRQGLSMDRDGAMAETLVVDARNCLPIPDDFSLIDGACIACTAGTAASAVMKAGTLPTQALVIGLGPLGMAVAQLVTALGSRVVGVDLQAGRRSAAIERGIAVATASEASDDSFPLVFETSGAAVGRRTAVAAAANGALVVLVGLAEAESEFPFEDAIMAELTLRGSNIWPINAYDDILELYRSTGVRPSELVSGEHRLDEAVTAFELAKSAAGKLVFRPSE